MGAADTPVRDYWLQSLGSPPCGQVGEHLLDGRLYLGPSERVGCGQTAALDQKRGKRGLLDNYLQDNLTEPLPLPIEPHLGCRGPGALGFLPVFCPRDVIEPNQFISRQTQYASNIVDGKRIGHRSAS